MPLLWLTRDPYNGFPSFWVCPGLWVFLSFAHALSGSFLHAFSLSLPPFPLTLLSLQPLPPCLTVSEFTDLSSYCSF